MLRYRARFLIAAILGIWGVQTFCRELPAQPEQLLSLNEMAAVLSLFSGGREEVDRTNRVVGESNAIRLGESLFFERRLSASGSVSCNSCHRKESNWTEGLAISIGEERGSRRTPSLWNVAGRRWFFWDGRAATLWSQALIPLESPTEMGNDRSNIVSLIQTDPHLRQLYELVFGKLGPVDGCTSESTAARSLNVCRNADVAFANVGKALAAFETTLEARNSQFDRYLACLRARRANCPQLSHEATAGLKLFIGRARCMNCHHGRDLTDEEFHDVLLPLSHAGTGDDPGRLKAIALLRSSQFGPEGEFSDCPSCSKATLVKQLSDSPDLFRTFKTPSLRGVADRAPYMHNGVYRTLKDVIIHYSTLSDASIPDHHLDALMTKLNLADAEINSLVAFLCTLSSDTGTISGKTKPLARLSSGSECD